MMPRDDNLERHKGLSPEQFCVLQGWGPTAANFKAAEQILAACPDLAAVTSATPATKEKKDPT